MGATTHLLRCPERNEAVVLLTNLSGGKSLAGPSRRLLSAAREAFSTAEMSAPE